MSVPITEPTRFQAGDTISWQKTISDYPASAGWTLKYILVSSGKTPISIDSTASGSDHLISVSAVTSAAYVPAVYHWTAYVQSLTERKTLFSGVLEILPNPATVTSATDPRTHAEKALEVLEAAILGKLTTSMAEYEIAGRRVKNYTLKEMIELRAIYRSEVRRQRGGSAAVAIPVRFSRV